MIPDEQKDQRVCGDINNGLSTGPKMSPPLSRRPCSESHYAPDGRGSSVTLGPALDKTAHYNHAPSWHSTWLYGGDTSTPFFILRTGNIVGAGGGGGFQQLGLFCPHACRFRGILAKFWALETHRQGGKGSYFDRVTLVVSQQQGQQDRGNISGHSNSLDYSDHIGATKRGPPSTLCVTSIGPML